LIYLDTSPLQFLKGPLIRFLEEYPSVRNGLARTERQILDVLSSGTKSPHELFAAMYPLEERIFMRDTTFWSRVMGLAAGLRPLVECSVTTRSRQLPKGRVKITPDGLAVLEGRDDRIKLNGINRWLGGVHLQAGEAAWRWDETANTLRRIGV
jgi:hypothetical protein